MVDAKVWNAWWVCGQVGGGQVDGLKHTVRGMGRAAHLLEKQWAADTTQHVWTRLPAQKLFPM